MKDEKKAEIKRVLLGRTVLGEDGRLVALPAGTFLRTPIGIGDGADAVLLFGITRRIRHYASKDGKARIVEAAKKSMQNIGRGLYLLEQPEATACLIRYILTRPAVLVFTWEDGMPMLTAWTGRGLTGWLSLRRAIKAFEEGLPDSIAAAEVKPSEVEKEPRKANKEEKKRQKAEKKAEKKTQRDAKKAAKQKNKNGAQPQAEPTVSAPEPQKEPTPQSDPDSTDEA